MKRDRPKTTIRNIAGISSQVLRFLNLCCTTLVPPSNHIIIKLLPIFRYNAREVCKDEKPVI